MITVVKMCECILNADDIQLFCGIDYIEDFTTEENDLEKLEELFQFQKFYSSDMVDLL